MWEEWVRPWVWVWCGVVWAWAWACGREIRLVRSAEMGEVKKVRSDENREHTDTRVLSKREEAVMFWEYGFREGNGSDLRQEESDVREDGNV
jgi:hypothetical protein